MSKKILYRFSIICFACFLFIGCDDLFKPREVTVCYSLRDSISFKPVGYLADVLSLEVYLDGEKVTTLDSDNNIYVCEHKYETGGPGYSYTLNIVPVIVEKHPTEDVNLEYYFSGNVGGVSVISGNDHYCSLNVSPDDYDEVIEKIRKNLTESYVVEIR